MALHVSVCNREKGFWAVVKWGSLLSPRVLKPKEGDWLRLSGGVFGELGAVGGNELAYQIEGEFGKFEGVGGFFHLGSPHPLL